MSNFFSFLFHWLIGYGFEDVGAPVFASFDMQNGWSLRSGCGFLICVLVRKEVCGFENAAVVALGPYNLIS
jgi:hypothetical protein